jgi:hypothetical protein
MERLPSEGEDSRGAGLERALDAASDHVQSVLEAAERAAEEIVRDAEAEAQRQLEQSGEIADRLVRERAELISELTDDLLRHAATARRRSDALVQELDEAIDRLSRELSEASGSPTGDEAERLAEPSPGAEAEEPTETEAARERLRPVGGSSASTGVPYRPDSASSHEEKPLVAAELARFLATQMALAGSSREEIETRLRDEFGVEDSSAILDSVTDLPDRSG